MKIIILGGCGFVGSNLARYLKKKYQDYEITAFDNLQRLGSDLNLQQILNEGIIYCHGDIRNYEDLTSIDEVDIIIDASAEPSVLAGLTTNPRKLINTNLLGSINCLEFAREKKAKVIFLSSSRVYPIKLLNDAKYLELETRFQWDDGQDIPGIDSHGVNENLPLFGYRSFYGYTKYASELLINEYVKYYGLKAIINRCGVISGPWQMARIDQGFVSLWILKHYFNGKLMYNGYNGQGKQLRDVLHIDDFCDLINTQINDFGRYNGETYNVGGGVNNTISLLELTEICEELTSNVISIKPGEKREADLRIYYTNNEKISSIGGWRPIKNVRQIMEDTLSWICKNDNILQDYFSV